MGKYIIAIDLGTQSAKASIYDLHGSRILSHRVKLRPLATPSPGVVEHPDDDLWDALQAVCKGLMAKYTFDKKDLIAVGLCSIRSCRVLLCEDGSLYSPVISWMDTRMLRPYEHLDDRVKYVTTTSGYLGLRLTGERRDTVGAYEVHWPYDFRTWQFDEKRSQELNLPVEMLFDTVMPGEILGKITPAAGESTGIPAGLPVVATSHDKAVEALGSGVIDSDSALISLGTYISGSIYRPTYAESESFWPTFSGVPGKYLYECYGVRRGMWLITWLINDLLGERVTLPAKKLNISPEEYLSQGAEKIPVGSDGLTTIPRWLPSGDAPHQRGVMMGFDHRHGPFHMYRSMLEGIAFFIKNSTDAMCKEANTQIQRLIISGGGANSRLFVQIFADVFGLPASRNMYTDAAGTGAAITAAVDIGEYKSFEEAAASMVRTKEQFEAVPRNTDLYSQINNEVYQSLEIAVDDILRKSQQIHSSQVQ